MTTALTDSPAAMDSPACGQSRGSTYVAFSGGVESTTLALLFGHKAQCVFTDTGAEHQPMYERLDAVETKLRRIHGETFSVLRIRPSRICGQPISSLPDLIRYKQFFPNQVVRFCTSEMNAQQTEKLASLNDEELRLQTRQQYNAVNHLATSLATVHAEVCGIIDKEPRGVVELQCIRSAEIMQQLADILDAMDAVDSEGDQWLVPIFQKANDLLG